MICIAHCYSTSNSGDGLLVELALDRVQRLFPNEDVVLVALDPDSFSGSCLGWGYESVYGATVPNAVGMALAGAIGGRRPVRQLFAESRLILGVGGGYLRGGSCKEALKSSLSHLSQLIAVSCSGTPAVYLPQSVGPFDAAYSSMVKRFLANVDTVCVRDDRSADLLHDLGNIVRIPDLAVLKQAEYLAVANTSSNVDGAYKGGRILVARELTSSGTTYIRTLRELVSSGFEVALQAQGRGNDDTSISETISGKSSLRSLADEIAASPGAVVVSTRLHGALTALMSGCPAIHLAYERKGWGAFDDLNLSEYVLNARSASSRQVLELTRRIEEDPAAYWDRVKVSTERLRGQSDSLDSLILRSFGAKSGESAK